MPFYEYQCKKCKKSLEVLRQFSEFDLPPLEEELVDHKTCGQGSEHDWERLIGGNQILSRGPNWSGRKGHW